MHPPIRQHCFQPVPATVVPHLKSTACSFACLLALLEWAFRGSMSNFSQQNCTLPTPNNSTLSSQLLINYDAYDNETQTDFNPPHRRCAYPSCRRQLSRDPINGHMGKEWTVVRCM
ncbi:hypothetical protein T02_2159 [Trichinella nativa]|uniref:Uncharacterized protein n=1 Tax=Trichinella nativa TaxID=6335 RepID=A0A0V1KYT1_9BILA|nr:hypothetical protein T02_2159 [Trichinella nativa]